MKNVRLLIIALTIISNIANSQTITTTIADTIPCCNHADSIDYNSDGNFDIKIKSQVGMDNNFYSVEGISNIEVTPAFNYGDTFNYYSSYTSFAGTTMGCFGWYSWIPGSGVKYIGFRKIVPNDTTYGWIKADFLGIQNTCDDTIVTQMVAYNQTPNSPLKAGEITTNTSIVNQQQEAIYENAFVVFPNPSKDFITIQNKSGLFFPSLSFNIFDFTGKVVWKQKLENNQGSITLQLESLAGGIYQCIIFSGNEIMAKEKLVVIK